MTVMIGSSALYPLAKGAIQMLLLLLLLLFLFIYLLLANCICIHAA